MESFADDFGPFSSIWMNTSHQGALPKAAAAALAEAVQWKISPDRMANSSLFSRVPARLKNVLGRLINAPAEDIILGNSASYGLHLLANGIKWSPGDEVLLIEGDFPSNILPWLNLKKRGIKIRAVRIGKNGLQPKDIQAHISNTTKVLCTSWVYSFTGHMIDLPAISEICREKGVKLVVNCSQAFGSLSFDIQWGWADAITCVGHKWLCGPYGTGFCWIKPEWREDLDYNQAYWLAMQTADDLKSSPSWPEVKTDLGARKFDVFGTANFFNFIPWTASVFYLLEKGIRRIKAYNDASINHLQTGLRLDKFDILTPENSTSHSPILVISHKDKSKNEGIFKKLKKHNIHISLRGGHLRFSPHLYNTEKEIDTVLAVLNSA